MTARSVLATIVVAFVMQLTSTGVVVAEDTLPGYLRDRGTGVPTSMFGSYINKNELLVYPFFEYYLDDDYEYKPSELGVPGARDHRGRYRASEYLLFVGYGLTNDIALEFEAAYIDARLDKSADDPSALADRLEESGLGDVEAQVRWRWNHETESRPELFSYFESVFPTGDANALIGTSEWELKLGAGLIKGLSFGTVTVRGAIEYAESEKKIEVGEIAVEYLRRLNRSWRVYLGVEGTQDEIELITEAQWHMSDRVYLKLNNAIGITSKATDWAPEVGVVFRF